MLKMFLGICFLAVPLLLTSCGQSNSSNGFNLATASRSDIEAELTKKGVAIIWYQDGRFDSSVAAELASETVRTEILNLIGAYKAAIYKDNNTTVYSALSSKDMRTMDSLGSLTKIVIAAPIKK